MGPDAELGVGEPVGLSIGAEGGAGVGVGAGGYGEGRGGGGLALVPSGGLGECVAEGEGWGGCGEELEGLAAGELHGTRVFRFAEVGKRIQQELYLPETGNGYETYPRA